MSVFGRENPVRSFRRPRASLSQWMLITVAPPLLSPLLTDGSIQCSVTAASFLREKFLLHFPDRPQIAAQSENPFFVSGCSKLLKERRREQRKI